MWNYLFAKRVSGVFLPGKSLQRSLLLAKFYVPMLKIKQSHLCIDVETQTNFILSRVLFSISKIGMLGNCSPCVGQNTHAQNILLPVSLKSYNLWCITSNGSSFLIFIFFTTFSSEPSMDLAKNWNISKLLLWIAYLWRLKNHKNIIWQPF